MVPQWFCSIQESFSIVGEPSGYCRRKHHPLLESVRESLPPYMQNTCVYGLMSFALFFPMVLNHSHLWLISLLWELASLICNGCSLASLIKKPWVFPVHSNEFGFSHQQTLSFFWFTQTSFFVHQKKLKVCWFEKPNSYFVHWKNSRFFDLRSQTASIAHQWSQFSQCTNQPWCSLFKTIGKKEQNSSRLRMYFSCVVELILRHFLVKERTIPNLYRNPIYLKNDTYSRADKKRSHF